MPRKGPAPKRPLIADPVYGSPVVTQLINKVLFDGKKTVAESIVYGALEGVRDKTDSDPVVILKRALENIRPALEVRSRRVGGATYQVPVEVRPARATTLALRWLVDYSRTPREEHDRASHERDSRCIQRPRGSCEAPRGHAQDGRIEQGLRALPLVILCGGTVCAVPPLTSWSQSLACSPPVR